MATMHNVTPEPLELGWFELCLPATDLAASMAFYERLGLQRTGGQPEHGWAIMSGGHCEIALMVGLEAHLLNFRGADIAVLSEVLRERGMEITGQSLYDPAKWPAALHTDAEGNTLPAQGSGDFTVKDPEGNSIYFDTVPIERAWHLAGQRWSTPKMPLPWPQDQPRLGRSVVMLGIGLQGDASIGACAEFYGRLGLRAVVDTGPATYEVEMTYAEAPERCSLILQGDPGFACAMYFRGADVEGWQSRLNAAGVDASVRLPWPGQDVLKLADPAGNLVLIGAGAE